MPQPPSKPLSALRSAGLFASPFLSFGAISAPSPSAAASATARASAQIVRPIEVTRLADLSFGTLRGGEGAGSVVVTPGGARRAVGGAVLIGHGGFEPAAFAVTGEPGATYVVSLPAQVEAVSGETVLEARDLEARSENLGSEGPGGRLDASGADELSVGGTIAVPAGAPAGHYTATFDVVVNYQ